MGIPISRLMSAAISSWRLYSAAPIAAQASARSWTGTWLHTSNAARAAATARSTSSGVPSGTLPMTSSVVGSMTSMVPAPAGLVHSPPMKNVVRSRVSGLVVVVI